MGSRSFCLIFRFDNNLFFQAGRFVTFYIVSNIFDQTFEFDLTGNFRYDNGVERVPFDDNITLLDCISILEEQFGTIRNVVSQQYDLRCRIDNTKFSQTADNNLELLTVFFAIHSTKFFDFQNTVIFRSDTVFCCHVRCDTTDMECTQCQLSTRFTD